MFEGRIIDQSHLEVGEFLGEGIATSTTLTQITINIVISVPKLCTINSLVVKVHLGKCTWENSGVTLSHLHQNKLPLRL